MSKAIRELMRLVQAEQEVDLALGNKRMAERIKTKQSELKAPGRLDRIEAALEKLAGIVEAHAAELSGAPASEPAQEPEPAVEPDPEPEPEVEPTLSELAESMFAPKSDE